MKKLFTAVLIGATFSMIVNAAETPLELLAGVEAGIDSDTVMTVIDLNKTQEILQSKPTGALSSWYNRNTTTHYDVIIGKHFSLDQRPCVSYKLTVKHSSKTEHQNLNACMNYDGTWIAQIDNNI